MDRNDEDEELRAVVECELRLLSPRVRRSADAVDGLLHPDFVEFGASGRVWDREAMLAAITGPELTPGDAAIVSELAATRLADDVVHLTYITRRAGRRVRRSSLWCKTDAGTWGLFFHQGTPIPDEEQ